MLRFAIIGLGVMGRNHYRVLKNLLNVEVVALCDPVIDNIYNEPFFRNLDDMLSSCKIDVAIVAVPTLHKEVAIKCLEKNTFVY